MADFVSNAASFMADPWGLGSSFTGGLAKSLGLDNTGKIDAAKGTLDEVLAKSQGVSAANRGIYGDYLSQMQNMYGENSSKYNDALQNVADAIGNYGDFEYTKDVNSFLDPAREQRVSSAMNALNNASAAGGSRFGSSYLNKLAAQQQAMASDEYAKAFDRMQTDRSNAMQEWQTQQNKINNLNMLANLYGNDRNQLSSALGDYYSNMANQNTADLQTYADVAGQKASLETQKDSGVGALLGGAGKIVAGIFGG